MFVLQGRSFPAGCQCMQTDSSSRYVALAPLTNGVSCAASHLLCMFPAATHTCCLAWMQPFLNQAPGACHGSLHHQPLGTKQDKRATSTQHQYPAVPATGYPMLRCTHRRLKNATAPPERTMLVLPEGCRACSMRDPSVSSSVLAISCTCGQSVALFHHPWQPTGVPFCSGLQRAIS
jgi:hypothetical protein